MAGLGRRTHYRKYLTDAVLFDLPEPGKNDRIGKIVATRGSNQFDVLIADSSKEGKDGAGDDRNTVLAILPTKFRKLVWLKRNDYVIAQTVDDDEGQIDIILEGRDQDRHDDKKKTKSDHDDDYDNSNTQTESNKKSAAKEANEGIRYMITHILYKDQIQHLVSKGLWPGHDPDFVSSDARVGPDTDGDVCDDGIVYQEYNDNSDDGSDTDADLFVNTNRVANLAIEDSSSSGEE